ncbi:MAG: hypothetical protein V3T72_00055 [Thermoanaerobaculia bacterium]
MGKPHLLRRRRPDRARHQHRRADHAADRARPEEPSVRRLRRRCPNLGNHRLGNPERQAQRRRALRLPPRYPGAHGPRPSDQPDRRPLALEIRQHLGQSRLIVNPSRPW